MERWLGAVLCLGLSLPVVAEERAYSSADDLACLSWAELECLYRKLEPGAFPDGFAKGKVIYRPCEKHAKLKSHASDVMWKGKHFCAADGTLINQWAGVRAIRGAMAYGPSWLDGKPSIILDYCGTSHVWADVRDETRQVCPGLYLGAMYLRRCPEPHHKVWFILETCP